MGNGMVGNERCFLRKYYKVSLHPCFYCVMIANQLEQRAWIQGAARKLRDKPLLGLVGSVIEDYEYLWDNYYFSTATL